MATINLSPFEDPRSWDFITIAGINSPGLCQLSDISRKYDFDKKKGKGTVGETITFTQKPAAEFTATFTLWENEHFVEWDTFQNMLKYDPTKKSITALEIYHPALAMIDLHSVVCNELGAPKHEGNMKFTIAVKFIEYFPPAKGSAVSTPSGSSQNNKDKDNTNPSVDPATKQANDEAQNALNSLADAYKGF